MEYLVYIEGESSRCLNERTSVDVKFFGEFDLYSRMDGSRLELRATVILFLIRTQERVEAGITSEYL